MQTRATRRPHSMRHFVEAVAFLAALLTVLTCLHPVEHAVSRRRAQTQYETVRQIAPIWAEYQYGCALTELGDEDCACPHFQAFLESAAVRSSRQSIYTEYARAVLSRRGYTVWARSGL